MVQTGALSKSKRAAGGGQLGEGAFKGYIAREKIDREKEKSNRADDYLGIAQEDLGIRKEEQGWKREDREKEKFIQEGMVEANKGGGYEGVIEYLKEVDPERALKFDQGKKNLDASIMKNDVMKTTSKLDKDKAMIESYGIIGKMGASIMNAPEEDRNAMYQRMLPMFKKINPNASNSWDANAQNDIQLAIAQATPANQVFRTNKDQVTALGREAKAAADIESRLAAGQTAENNPQLKAMLDKQAKISEDAQSATLKKTALINQEAKQNTKDKRETLTYARKISKEIATASTPFLKFADAATKVEASIVTLQKDPKNFVAKAMVGRMIAKLANGVGVLTQPDVDELIRSASGSASLIKKIKSIASGKKEDLNQDEMDDLFNMYDALKEKQLAKQQKYERQELKQIKEIGGIDPKHINLPSNAFLGGNDKLNQDAKGQEFIQSVPPQMQGFVKEALDSGVSIDAIKSRMQQMQQGQENR